MNAYVCLSNLTIATLFLSFKPSCTYRMETCFIAGSTDGSAAAGGFDLDEMTAADSCNGAGSYRVTGRALLLRHFYAIMLKRFRYMTRSKKGFFAQV